MNSDQTGKEPITPPGGKSDDDIFAEMGRMLAQDQQMAPKPAPRTLPDTPPPEDPPAAAAPAESSVPGDDDEPLELTEVIAPGRAVGGGAPAPVEPPAADVSEDSTDPLDLSLPAAPEPSPPEPEPEPVAAQQPEPVTVAAAAAKLSTPAASPSTQVGGDLDGYVRDVIREKVEAWLDANLERIVREEVEKATRDG